MHRVDTSEWASSFQICSARGSSATPRQMRDTVDTSTHAEYRATPTTVCHSTKKTCHLLADTHGEHVAVTELRMSVSGCRFVGSGARGIAVVLVVSAVGAHRVAGRRAGRFPGSLELISQTGRAAAARR